MKKFYSFLAIAAALSMASCSNDEPAMGGDQFEGDTAYMVVNIGDVSSQTRSAQGDETNPFYFGTADETAVSTADFYFFDKDGNYVNMKASIWVEGGTNGVDAPTTNHIEHLGQNTIVLKNLTGQNYPEYMLTVINQPAGWAPKATLAETSLSLDANSTWKNAEDKTMFVMSTTSYSGTEGDHDNAYYYATKLQPQNFLLESPTKTALTDANAVQVYVERLAAKVKVDFAAKMKDAEIKTINGVNYYKVKASIAGFDNGNVGQNTAATEVWVRMDGWGLNGTAKETYLSKQLTLAADYMSWANDDAHRRSYWAETWGYNEVTGDNKLNKLDYYTLNDFALAAGGMTYCNEFTNPTNCITNTEYIDQDGSKVTNAVVNPALTTCVVIKATVCTIGENNEVTTLDLVNYNGLLYKKEDFLKYVLNRLQHNGTTKLNFYTKSGDTYTQIGESYLDFALTNEGTGKIKVVANIPAGVEVYSKNGVDAEGKTKYEPIANPETALNNEITSAMSTYELTAFTGGAMFYTIPVEHLQATVANQTNKNYVEGYYGVVRNHFYTITVDNILRLGHGVYDPENETIIPDTPEDYRYYVGAKINILSWKVVNQNASL